MSEEEDNLFVVNDPEENYNEGSAEEDVVDEVTTNVEDLVPLCVKRAQGPLLSTATFGYDIENMTKKPWNQPEENISDYFNYGFDETTWRLYCAMQKDGEASLLQQAKETLARLKLNAYQADGEPAEAETFETNPYNHYNDHQQQHQRGYRSGGPRHSAYKTRICQAFMDGKCQRGAECNFAHGEAELRVPNMMDMKGNNNYMGRANYSPNNNNPYIMSNVNQPVDDNREMKRHRRDDYYNY